VDLCGHATLASAHVLWEDGHLARDGQARFHTRSGLLTADRRGAWIELDFPVKIAATADPAPQLLPALGIASPVAVAKNVFDYLVEVESEERIDEDPVTGSAHAALAPYWGARLRKAELTGYQASARGGIVRVRLSGDRVILGGQAVTMMHATLLV
jgi:predicted PhzF superfamily epimerase YddE/YHI9